MIDYPVSTDDVFIFNHRSFDGGYFGFCQDPNIESRVWWNANACQFGLAEGAD